MTIDEAIAHAREVAEVQREVCETHIFFDNVTFEEFYADDTEIIEKALYEHKRCAEEHEQLAEWLEELKTLRAEIAEMHDERQAEIALKREHDEQIRADAEAEHKAMCESCIHKVSADDIKAIRDSAIDDALHRILCLASHKAEFYSLENGEMIEAMQIEDIDKMIYEELAEQLKENSNGS